ncbi:L-aspartate oxidase [Oceanidesulfovibrio marinus]|uniref:L-aspartate oxidase n=1 Tax=Oceanidesulfovibrio marinus TaxID=370038 RepID=A0A6P1ZAY2_9BACT|nr:L-aspartate oxidase [Oceanidesulfovibrio marinus]QJT09624.1 L-aspartate oxidase [Oceanidesulfovibrio marinus]TVM30986.1 L-aspartate oxidase [Oceanidesulfovibrio marinus]
MSRTRHLAHALVIGSGIAGASCALNIADQGFEVILLTTGPRLDDGNTVYAQGGIVYTGQEDSPALLMRDIKKAGCYHSYDKAVRYLATKGAGAVERVLMDRIGVRFATQGMDKDEEYDLTREGGHSIHRVLHCADYTGRAIMERLILAVEAHPNIRVLSRRTAVDLITSQHHARSLTNRYQRLNQCLGAYVFNESAQHMETVLAEFTVLATGGMGRIFLHSTNARCARGSGLTMAHRAGARLMNVEYVQFHPTALYHKSRRRFLITEAMRGEGALLRNGSGERFVLRYDPRGELAPRDVVSRAIVDEMHRSGDPCVFLDCSEMTCDLTQRFPTIHKKCLELGLDITRDQIPVVPAAHYQCGGVVCDSYGRTDINGLYAVGECSCTGLHGANRLASTSLLEGVLWGESAGVHIAKQLSHRRAAIRRLLDDIADWSEPAIPEEPDPALLAQDWGVIQSTMWNYVGITRTRQRLKRAVEELRSLYGNLTEFYKRTPLSKPLVDIFHSSYAAYIVANSALRNPESKGCHYME